MKNIKILRIILWYLMPCMSIGLCAILSSCEDNKTPELIFTEVSNSAPEHIQFDFSSPDPACVPRRAVIYVDQFGGEISIKSTNAHSISLGYKSDPNNNFFTDHLESDESNSDYRYSEYGQWSVRLINHNTLVFEFESVDVDDNTTNGAWYSLPVCATVDGTVVNRSVEICRVYDYNFNNKSEIETKRKCEQ